MAAFLISITVETELDFALDAGSDAAGLPEERARFLYNAELDLHLKLSPTREGGGGAESWVRFHDAELEHALEAE